MSKMIRCKLVYDSGTMIRFTTSQLGLLPKASCDMELPLPKGGLVPTHFQVAAG